MSFILDNGSHEANVGRIDIKITGNINNNNLTFILRKIHVNMIKDVLFALLAR